MLQLQRIGFDQVHGVLWGIEGWRAASYPLSSYAVVDADAFAAAASHSNLGSNGAQS
jgi:hypothetical protein